MAKDTRQKTFLVEFYGGYIWRLTRQQYEKVLKDTLLEGEFPSSPDEGAIIVRGFETAKDWPAEQIRRTLKDLQEQDREAKEGKKISNFVTCLVEKD